LKARMVRPLLPVIVLICVSLATYTQDRRGVISTGSRTGQAIIHENVDIAHKDTFYGPGGRELMPDLSRVSLSKKRPAATTKNTEYATAQGRWLADRLLRLRDSQIRDAFRAADYSPAEIDILTSAVKTRIRELDVATSARDRIADTLPRKPNRTRQARSRRH
jgi:hypothetical protein